MQSDDESRAADGGSIPLYILLSIAAVFVVTLGTIGFITVRNVQATPEYVVSVHAPSAAEPPAAVASTPPAVAVAPVAAAHAAQPRAVTRHLAVAPKASVSAAPKASAAPAPSPAPVAKAPAAAPVREVAQAAKDAKIAKAHAAALRARRVAEASSGEGSDAAPQPATRPVWATAAPEAPAAVPVAAAPVSVSVAPPAQPVHAAPATAAPAAATPAAVAAVPAPVYAPDRIVEARVRSAVEPDFPPDPSVQGAHGTSSVLVTIGPHGNVLRVAIDKSSGHTAFDQAALNAARNSSYEPPEINGRAATASYRMVYEFSQ